MNPTISLAELRARGVVVAPHEAIAIAQSLIHADVGTFATHSPFGPPTLENVVVNLDGSVACDGCAATPAVSEIAILLQAMLLPGTIGVAGGLRYALGRALLEVEAPPFDSLADFSRALARFERGDRTDVIASLYARACGMRETALIVPFAPPLRDRRRHALSATELRRQLREADRRLFELQQAAADPVLAPPPRWTKRVPVVTCLAAGFALIVAGEAMHVWNSVGTLSPAVPQVTAAVVPKPLNAALTVPQATASVVREPLDATLMPRASRKTDSRARLVADRPSRRGAVSRATASRRIAGRSGGRRTASSGVLARIRFEWNNPFSQRPRHQ